MTTSANSNTHPDVLVERYYNLRPEEISFFKLQTGIDNDDALKDHIITVQTKALKIFPYYCIHHFAFTTLKISRLPAYDEMLKLGRERQNAILLDMGCCFGNDVRKAVADGFPTQGTIGFDLHSDFWQLGHELFKSTPESFQASFIAGDVFEPRHLEIVAPAYDAIKTPAPSLATLTSLNPLHGHISAIHTSSFFHLFDERKQSQLAHALGGLLSPEPGSVIFGSHGGLPEKGYRTEEIEANKDGPSFMFCHSPESWRALWDGEVFQKGTVQVDTQLQKVDKSDYQDTPLNADFYFLVWSVTRV